MNSEEEKSFKVNDKRKFSADGEQLESSASQESSKSEDNTAAESSASDYSLDERQETNGQEIAINFPSFVASLGTQALMLLGQIPVPEGMPIQVDVKAAKQTIDILEMLKEKTAGNLEAEEAKFFEEMLHNLRIAYLQQK